MSSARRNDQRDPSCSEIAGAELVDILFVVNRGSPDIGIPYKTLVTIDVERKRCEDH